ncbi:putative lysosomal acid lipase/cholesteryl ester hydrolase [Thamnophis elegans]|uniref:putative lysosomal acid lipase/cholesteryl ester hydrolase n=1 Tax=Thamnophis elegans TaxID=35005 RepID=UPI001377A553|nr:putative lysosomal acid lipase/cholesteryl ester hydrolase [Thamnophis elegans]
MWSFIVLAYLIRGLAGYEEFLGQKLVVNPEAYMTVGQMISYHGYPNEEYEVLTEDGYYLTINRIPRGRKNIAVIDGKPVAFLQHGLLGEGRHWVENMANNSLGFILADAGYDVWLGNSRGTTLSQKHQSLSVDQEEFWNFSFHEMAMYDLPATINFILKKTKQKQLYYIGHSQGSTIGFIAFSAMPELSQKVKMFFALAPVVYVKHVPNTVLRFVSQFPQHSFKSRMDVYAAHYPETTSVKNLLHWQQMLTTGLFRWFDYGDKNQGIYKQSVPPSYQIEGMSVLTAVWSGGQDTLADPKDVELLLPGIVNLVYHRSWSDWSHWDFVWGLNAPQRMFFEILQVMERSG